MARPQLTPVSKMTGAVAYNPYDPLQQAFLGSLAQGETGGAANSSMLGFGGANLAGAPTNQYGFPIWNGMGNSQAAGTYQFQPATWDNVASEYGLNFQNPSNQSEGAWYLAQQTYAAKNNGGSLETALQNGNVSSIQNSLSGVWPSVTGNASNPGGLTSSLGGGLASDLLSGNTSALTNTMVKTNGLSAPTNGAGTSSSSSSSGGIVGTIESLFVRFGLVIVGGIVILIALYFIVKPGNLGSIKDALAVA
jgi:muramidase (phage lysozyme)